MVKMTAEEYDSLQHIGVARRSGRYPWGSGKNPRQSHQSWLSYYDDLKKSGEFKTDSQIAKAMGISTRQMKARRSIAIKEKRQDKIHRAQRLRDKGYSLNAIAKEMGVPNESSVRALLAPGALDKANQLHNTADMLMRQVDDKTMIDVGVGTEVGLNISRQTMETAFELVEENGYKVHSVFEPQVTTGEKTRMQIIAPADMEYKEILARRGEIRQINEWSEDMGRSYEKLPPLQQLDSKRIAVNYAEDGGDQADGVMYIRPGVEDISMGNSNYAQVRIAVDGTHYLKGMAVYKDDLPEGTDIVFNTNKTKDTPMMGDKNNTVLKLQNTDDPDNPFGAYVKRRDGALNILDEEGAWHDWSRTLSSQVLSKQKPALANTQLKMRYEGKRDELDEILALTNPTVRKKLLDTFANGADASAVTLEAAKLPRQAYHVLLPINSLKENEVFAPQYRNGENLVLIRYPHGGTFEIPELRVNNKNREGLKAIGKDSPDAIGINAKVAQKLSGADFDGDTVLAIPNGSGKIKTSPALESLKTFDPHREYAYNDGMKVMGKKYKQTAMGKVSNLITDMTIKGASQDELARAVKHSMVVIDAEKHRLDYQRSAKDNNIAALQKKYQPPTSGSPKAGGASTIVSRAKGQKWVDQRRDARVKEGGPINKKTGERQYVDTGETYVDKKGRTQKRRTQTTQLGDAKDAFSLSSGTPIEDVYAAHANRMKSLANEARRESVNTKITPRSPSAARVYKPEVESLDRKLKIAQMNRPRERQAQVVANAIIRQNESVNPGMDDDKRSKMKRAALKEARARTGAEREPIDITPKEWEAIQAGAISNNQLTPILKHTDLTQVKEYATPRTRLLMSDTKTRRAAQMAASGYTRSEIADQLGVSTTTLQRALSGA